MVTISFDIGIIGRFTIFGQEFLITQTTFSMWLIMAALIVVGVVVRIKMLKATEVPRGIQNFFELVVSAFDGMLRGAAGDKMMFLGNWFFTVFAFILVSNLSGMLPIPGLRPPTADWAMTFPLAFVTFVLIQVMGIKFRKGRYIKTLFEPNFVFFPLNVIGELARPVSLSFRLYGNVLAGMILITMFYTMAPIFVQFFIPIALHGFFDLFSGFLQTFIFCILSMTFIGVAASDD